MPKLRPILIGQAPSQLTDSRGRIPFSGNSGRFLANLLQIPQAELLDRFDARNLLDVWPGKADDKGDAFPISAAKESAARILPTVNRRTVVLAGRGVATAFGLSDMEFLERRKVGLIDFVLLPHPSGINLWWNRLVNKRRAARLLRELLGLESDD